MRMRIHCRNELTKLTFAFLLWLYHLIMHALIYYLIWTLGYGGHNIWYLIRPSKRGSAHLCTGGVLFGLLCHVTHGLYVEDMSLFLYPPYCKHRDENKLPRKCVMLAMLYHWQTQSSIFLLMLPHKYNLLHTCTLNSGACISTLANCFKFIYLIRVWIFGS